jgi:hypothetical protein
MGAVNIVRAQERRVWLGGICGLGSASRAPQKSSAFPVTIAGKRLRNGMKGHSPSTKQNQKK